MLQMRYVDVVAYKLSCIMTAESSDEYFYLIVIKVTKIVIDFIKGVRPEI